MEKDRKHLCVVTKPQALPAKAQISNQQAKKEAMIELINLYIDINRRP